MSEVRKEAEAVAGFGIKHILLLTGESRGVSPLSYIKECVAILREYFNSVSIEIYPLEAGEYSELIAAGVDGLAVYQETYDEELYSKLHLKGPKKNFRFRLETAERACNGNIRGVSIGALLGLSEFKKECFLTLIHAAYLQDKYPDVEISVSFPRIQPQAGGFKPSCVVTDRDLAQLIFAARIFMPRIGINMSTREKNELRLNLMGLGVTKVSAGSSTEVGGYSLSNRTEGQFTVADRTSVKEMKELIYAKGFQPVMKDWDHY
jgi:2-iminoacetate synthase